MSVLISAPHDVVADPTMPFIARALDPAYLQPRLSMFAAGGTDRLELRAIRVTRWKPARRCLIEYDLASRDDEAAVRTLVGKVRARSVDRATCALAKQLGECGLEPDSPDGVSVPAVRGALDECHMWVQDKVYGVPGWRALIAPDGQHVARRIGGALAKLHRVLPPLPRRHFMADEIAALRNALEEMRRRRPEWDRRLWAVQRACELLAAKASPPIVSGVHRDFYHDQVIVNGDRIWLLDLDLAAEGDPALDAGNFTAHLVEQSLRTQGNPDALAAHEAAFLSEFCCAAGAAHRANIEIYKTLSLARHIHLSATFESRRHNTNALLTLCESRLGL